jgi:hypothetical protein
VLPGHFGIHQNPSIMKNQSSVHINETLIVYLIAAGLFIAVMAVAYLGLQG